MTEESAPSAIACAGRQARISLLAPYARYALRSRADDLPLVAAAYAWPVPARHLRACREGPRCALWLGPDELLLIDERPESAPVVQRDLGTAHSWVDVRARHVALDLEGPDVASQLSATCPLNLEDDAFPVGACTRTVLAKCEILLWRTAEMRFRLEIGRSYLSFIEAVLARPY